ncbi:MAG: ABC transporter ATP-binding protein [Phycisphaeraceae bacterium]|nr:ABC transporter ATP-binding protein [Phycisphaerales bacterium]MCB9860122.1 ABC transporter ATP-binding protein [Phycisphaeraceae bacterium]
MQAYWKFARRMLKHPWRLAAAIVCAVLAGGTLGSGILAALPMFENILKDEDAANLPSLATDINEALPTTLFSDSFIASLPTSAYSAVLWIAMGLGVLTMIGAAFNITHALLSLHLVQNTIKTIRDDAFASVIRLPLSNVIEHGAADKASRIVNDTAILETGLNSMLSRALPQVTKGLASLIAAVVIEWRLTLGALILGPVLYTVIRKFGKKIRRASRSAMEEQASLYGASMESLQGLRVVKVYTAEQHQQQQFAKINELVTHHMLRARGAKAISSPVVEMISLLVLGIIFVVVAKAILDGEIDRANVMLAMGGLFVAGAAVKPLNGLINDIQTGAAAADRLDDMMHEADEPGHDASLPPIARLSDSLVFDRVTFTYPGRDDPALREFSLRIPAGQTIAIIGANGSGKTTALSLVPRLFDPDSGQILIDNTSIHTVNIGSLRDQIAVVTQETVLFRVSIADNIMYGKPDATREQIIDAAKKARAHEFISNLPHGYDTMVGEQGLSLSGGQRQRIAIARAILRDPAILILDEATSMIDAESEAMITQAISEFVRGRTCLIIAHRRSTIEQADRIVTMENGKVIRDEVQHATEPTITLARDSVHNED